MTDPRQSTKNYTQPHPVPVSDTLVLGAAKATSYGPRVEPYNDGIVEPAKSDMDADFWSVYEWRTSQHALEGGWWEWLADCDTENVARTLAEAIARCAQQPASHPAITPSDDEVVFIDGVGAGRRDIKSCRDGVQWIVVGDRVYWPLSDSDAKRLQSACCGNGSFDGPTASGSTS